MSKTMKLFVTSDIHGHYTILKDALEQAGFDPENDQHLFVSCGDYFDRGNENELVLKFLERLKRKVLIRGNHEDMLLDLLNTGKMLSHHYFNGTDITMENFFGKRVFNPSDGTLDFSGQTRTVDRICDFIGETANYFETEKYVFVHGWVPKRGESAEGRKTASADDWKKARWEGWNSHYKMQRPLPDKTLICGHVPTYYGSRFDLRRPSVSSSIFYGDGLVALDACTVQSQKINVLVLEDQI